MVKHTTHFLFHALKGQKVGQCVTQFTKAVSLGPALHLSPINWQSQQCLTYACATDNSRQCTIIVAKKKKNTVQVSAALACMDKVLTSSSASDRSSLSLFQLCFWTSDCVSTAAVLMEHSLDYLSVQILARYLIYTIISALTETLLITICFFLPLHSDQVFGSWHQ